MEQIKKIRKECSYELRELKYSSTDYSQILCAVRFIDYFLSAQDLYFKIIIKDNLFFNKNYFEDNHYGMDKAVLSKCPGIAEKCKMKTNYYWPSFEYQKINVFYWKNKIIASLGKSLSRS